MSTRSSKEDIEMVEDCPPSSFFEEDHPDKTLKINSHGVTLVPQPSDDPRDPLNWSTWKKTVTLAIVTLAAFAGVLQSLANASGFAQQAALYHKTSVQQSYSLSVATAGLAVGPFIWNPLAARFGNCAMILWSLVMTLGMNIWSARMVKPDQYIPFLLSRLCAGITGTAPATIGTNVIIQIYFLHDRGKYIGIFSTCVLFGTMASSTLSGYIVEGASWVWQFWYNVILGGVCIILCLLFLEEPIWNRPGGPEYPTPPEGWLTRRLATYAFTKRLTPKVPIEKSGSRAVILPLFIALSPVTMAIGLAHMIGFGFSIGITTFIPIYLQAPVMAGGYGFSPARNAAFTFVYWFAVLIAQVYVVLVSDRLSLWLCKRNGGAWKPEYRLHALWIPGLFAMPLGLGLFAATLVYHWHYMMLAFATFLVVFSNISIAPVCANYLIEAFAPELANEVNGVLNSYRLIFGVAIGFFLFPWADNVGIKWTYGTQAFLAIFAFGMMASVMKFGQRMRLRNLVKAQSEEGMKVIS
ncbi:Efflux pump rdc3 [Fusarium oxysporum f. sp. raphani]|nr:Efflux pump rdc3 [Fusarium oxysporum f. sp. raphani]